MKDVVRIFLKETGTEKFSFWHWVVVIWWALSLLMFTASTESFLFIACILVNFAGASYAVVKLPFENINE